MHSSTKVVTNGNVIVMTKAVEKLVRQFQLSLFLRHSSSGHFFGDDSDSSDSEPPKPSHKKFDEMRLRSVKPGQQSHYMRPRYSTRPWDNQNKPRKPHKPFFPRDRDDDDYFREKLYSPQRNKSRHRTPDFDPDDAFQRPKSRQSFDTSDFDYYFGGDSSAGSGYRGRDSVEFDKFSPGSFRDSDLGANLRAKDWNSQPLEAVEKNFYVEHPAVKEMSDEEVESYYRAHDITLSKGERVRPILDFKHANFTEAVNKYMHSIPWQAPTPIQSLGWPVALSGKDLVAIARTGSGKTLGFVLPGLVHVKHQRQVASGEGPLALVLAPTRELTQQIQSVCTQFGRSTGVHTAAVFGGQNKMVQARQLSEGPEIVVATPGRLLDFLETGVTTLARTTYLVLDEADRMLDMGFEPQIRKVLSQIRPDRQTLLWSATWAKDVQHLSKDFLSPDFTQINIGSAQLVANPNISQDFKLCQRRDKFNILVGELRDRKPSKTLVFVRTKAQADTLTMRLRRERFRALPLHGDKSQRERDANMYSFKTGEINLLVATDVASRGLDVSDIELVVNFDYPNTIDDYIHRIGRTARANRSGQALTFLIPDDIKAIPDVVSVLTTAGQPVPPQIQEIAQRMSKQKFKKY